MGRSTQFPHTLLLALTTALMIIVAPVHSQSSSNSLCSGPMIRSFSSCIGYLSGGSSSSSPTSACCGSLKDLMSNGQDCLCLIVTGGVPFQVPINRNLAISLPKACKMSGVPIECKATASPVPAPGPGSAGQGGPSIYPGLSPPSIYPGLSPPNPTVPFIPQPLTPPSLTPGGGRTPPLSPDVDVVPTLTPPGMRPTLTPSAAEPISRYSALSSSLLAAVVGFILLK